MPRFVLQSEHAELLRVLQAATVGMSARQLPEHISEGILQACRRQGLIRYKRPKKHRPSWRITLAGHKALAKYDSAREFQDAVVTAEFGEVDKGSMFG